MKSARFWLGLWSGKFATWIYKMRGMEQKDRSGTLARRFDIDFIKDAAKPATVTVVTGTNGKTSMVNMLKMMHELNDQTVIANTHGNNTYAGQAWIFLKANSVFNKPIKDVAVIESDELFSYDAFPQMEPNFIIVTNIARDSMFRNASPDFVQDKLDRGLSLCPDATLILNGDDPLSCFLGSNTKRVYFGVSDLHAPQMEYPLDDFVVCPKCGAHPKYHYRNFRNIGDFYCPVCGMKAPEKDYLVVDHSDKSITVQEKDGSLFDYPLFSSEYHSIYNCVSIVAYFRQLGWSREKIAECLAKIKLPENRDIKAEANGVKVLLRTAKNLNFTACSISYENDSLEHEKKNVVILSDEEHSQANGPKFDVATWIYDIEYEFLNRDNVLKIVVGGDRYLDHRMRLLMAGIPAEKIIAVRDIRKTAELVDVTGVDTIAIYRDNYNHELNRYVFERILERLKER